MHRSHRWKEEELDEEELDEEELDEEELDEEELEADKGDDDTKRCESSDGPSLLSSLIALA